MVSYDNLHLAYSLLKYYNSYPIKIVLQLLSYKDERSANNRMHIGVYYNIADAKGEQLRSALGNRLYQKLLTVSLFICGSCKAFTDVQYNRPLLELT